MPATSRSLLFYVAIGLIQGLVFLYARHIQIDIAGLPFGLCSAVLVAGANLQLLGSAVLQRGTGWLVLGLTLLIGFISSWTFSQDTLGWVWQSSWLAAIVLAYIGTAFILSWPTREGLRPRYEDLFRHAWNNVFIVLLALLFTLLFWLLLWLCGRLFLMLGIPQVEDVLTSAPVLRIGLAVVFSLGMRMGLENEKVIGLLRGVLLTLCRVLLPLSALIAVLFSLALPFTGLQPVWNTGYSTTILLLLVATNLFLLNGVFQDGHQANPYPGVLKRLVEACLLCLPVLVALAGYSSWLRVDQYGLTPERILALLLIGVMQVHSLAALWAVFASRQGWLHSLRVSNPWIALLSAVLVVLFYTPLLNPLQISANNQVERLLSGRTAIQEFDARTLYHRLGKPGREAFKALEARLKTDELFDAQGREKLLGIMDEAHVRYAEDTRGPKLEWLGPEQPGSEAFATMVMAQSQCGGRGCFLWGVDMDGDGRNEVLMIPRHTYASSVFLFAREGEGEWREVGSLHSIRDNTERLVQLIRNGQMKPVMPRYKTLTLDGDDLTWQPNR
ncbi:DUF4153 domain-containing protein [Pseudomonas rubra]|uniref:DUF4153 domain-containing protein n=1 Tax=Pseudomonas rubra TaxID=2942627 RepID=A0ABT5P6Y8_9PSED|nr:DUF4153 domain-containing protein [Pseudomonas rubra]MDD1013922.1 DUF4153 domain-containing protein [Pseudomonas rubra]MDD1038856.1 DUF4153 domain-containing protein [Pseudomonas rubra]MDD1154390.1 DUF4153 domain-containing protein [Pseudomonas rubra]